MTFTVINHHLLCDLHCNEPKLLCDLYRLNHNLLYSSLVWDLYCNELILIMCPSLYWNKIYFMTIHCSVPLRIMWPSLTWTITFYMTFIDWTNNSYVTFIDWTNTYYATFAVMNQFLVRDILRMLIWMAQFLCLSTKMKSSPFFGNSKHCIYGPVSWNNINIKK